RERAVGDPSQQDALCCKSAVGFLTKSLGRLLLEQFAIDGNGRHLNLDIGTLGLTGCVLVTQRLEIGNAVQARELKRADHRLACIAP
ncbi:hypothetical protein, partial [Paraburkholderia mimosarum]|uniref:hypothetical protein n=1 Tax=Paraburkholderia mimosarum TaxID=312026 RepID=UPI003B50982A